VAQAACWATYVHDRAAHHAARARSTFGVVARDLVEAVPQALVEVDDQLRRTAG